MKILVTGCGGYIGTTLVPYLLRKGYEVRCLDRLYFGQDLLNHVIGERGFELVKGDVRTVSEEIMKGIDAVIDMASLSNDPAGELNPKWTMSINYMGRVRIASMARKAEVERYVLFSSCSVYGKQESLATEESEPRPLTTYAMANLLAEREILPLSSKTFSATALRLATVYGPSKRMRFDLLVNGMVMTAFTEGRIKVLGDGSQLRPLVHVLDVARAVETLLQKDPEEVSGLVINVGSENLRVIDVAMAVKRILGGELEFYGSPDIRSYAVSFEKAKRILGFEPLYNVSEGIKQIYHELLLGNLMPEPRFFTVDWYKRLLKSDPRVLEP